MPAQITALPTPPSTNDPANFNTRADAFLGQMPTFVTQANALAAEVNANATQIAADRVQTGLDRSAAAASAASALGAPGTNATSSTSLTIGVGVKSMMLDQTGKAFGLGQRVSVAVTASPTNRMSGIITGFNTNTGVMTVSVDYVPAGANGSATAWTIALDAAPPAAVAGFLGTRTLASTDSVVIGDLGKVLRATGNVALTMLPASTAGANSSILIHNATTANAIMITRGGSDTIDGLLGYKIYPGETRLFEALNGTTWISQVITPFYMAWTATDSFFVWPPGYIAFEGAGWGAGGDGGTGNASTTGRGGSGAPYIPYWLPVSSIVVGASATITVGMSGGANSSIGSLVTMYGGINGSAVASGNPPTRVWNGDSSNYSYNTLYDGGAPGNGVNSVGGAIGFSSMFGGGGGAGGAFGSGVMQGGVSLRGGKGGSGADNANAAQPGLAPGGGGGGGALSSGASAGGLGGRGEVRMWGLV